MISVSSMSMRSASTNRGASSSVPTKRRGCRFCNARYPTQPVQPGKPEKREHEYIRHGVRALARLVRRPDGPARVESGPDPHQCGLGRPSGQRRARNCPRCSATIGWSIISIPTGASRSAGSSPNGVTSRICPKALQRGVQRRAFLSDPTHQHVFHFTPKHGSWLNQVELWFSVLARRFLKRGDFASAHDFETRLCDYLEVYNTHHAHPYRWTYTGQPLVRATPFSQTRRQRRQGRAWFSPRPQRFERAFYPPRPYKRSAGLLVANL